MSKPKLHEPHDDVKRLLALYDQLRSLHRLFYDHVSLVGDRMKARKYDLQDLTDLGFLNSKVAVMMEEWRKDAKARREFADRLICLAVMEAGLSDPSKAEERSQGSLASGSPDVKMEVAPPEPGQPGYVELARHLGMPEDAIQKGLVKFSWTKLSELITKAAEDGAPPPPGIGKPWPVHNVRYYAKGPARKEHEGF
jgi:hypothetical protein